MANCLHKFTFCLTLYYYSIRMTEAELGNFYIQLGINIKRHREQAGLKQEAFATMLNLSRASIVNIEKGRQRPPLHLMWDISKQLKISVSEILSPLENINVSSGKEKINADWKKRITASTKGDLKSRKKITDFINEITLTKTDDEPKKD
jgi:DNA-binding XRE family transcriptional regulator